MRRITYLSPEESLMRGKGGSRGGQSAEALGTSGVRRTRADRRHEQRRYYVGDEFVLRIHHSYLEAAVVMDSARDPIVSRRFDELCAAAEIRIEPVTDAQARTAREAYRDFGNGSGHPAGLNFGDCFAYALAKDTGEPLLFKGKDFIHTDLASALPLSAG
jgi:ribonuclease VapC